MMIGNPKSGRAQDRPAYNAGIFYPRNPHEIRQSIQQYLDAAVLPEKIGKPFGIISPHAGYPYSGPVAAYGFKALENQHYEAVIVISPCHVDYFNFASIYNGDNYLTPLGKVRVDKSLAAQFQTADKLVKFSDKGHTKPGYDRAEQSLEVQLPFLQMTLGDIPIVPIVLGTMDQQVIKSLGNQLGKISSENDILIIASSDLSHYHSYKECKRIDQKFTDILVTFNIDRLYRGMVTREIEACGGGPIISLMLAAQMNNAQKIRILNYANSGDVPFGDKSRVVGYLSAAFCSGEPTIEKTAPDEANQSASRSLNQEEQEFLLTLAEDVVTACVKGDPIPKPQNIPAICKEKRGAFVTLEKNHQLRGCIGYILPYYPLYETVIEVAQSAAVKDPRFNPVAPSELKDIDVEVSVLTVPEVIDDPTIIEVGKHGIIMKRGFQQGLLLPQVATEYGWDRTTFLEQTCRKAGLPKDAWQDKNTEISIFSAQVFNRETLK